MNEVQTDERFMRRALELAREATEMSGAQNPDYLDTLALAYHLTGSTRFAVETQKRALSLLQADDPRRSEFEVRLDEFEAAL